MVIVLGASGFIGLYTVERLIADGKKVLATGRDEKMRPMLEKMGADFETLDITNKADFSKLPTEGVEGVILLAGLLPANVNVDISKDENAEDYFQVNVIGTINVLEYCRKWVAFQERFTAVLPAIPVYSNVYFDFYTSSLQNYDPMKQVSWAQEILYAVYGDAPESFEDSTEADDGQVAFIG